MREKKHWILVAILAVVCGSALCTIISCVDKEESEDYTELTGLKGLYVMVECVSDSDAHEDKRRREELFERYIVSKLQERNIKVYTKEEMYNDERNPTIYLNVQAECYPTDSWIYSVRLSLLETVELRKEPPEELLELPHGGTIILVWRPMPILAQS